MAAPNSSPGPGTWKSTPRMFPAVVDVDCPFGNLRAGPPDFARAGRARRETRRRPTSTSQLSANSFETGRTFVFDLSDPADTRLLSPLGETDADALPIHRVSLARRAGPGARHISRGLAADHWRGRAGWSNWTTEGVRSGARSAADLLDSWASSFTEPGGRPSARTALRRQPLPTCTG